MKPKNNRQDRSSNHNRKEKLLTVAGVVLVALLLLLITLWMMQVKHPPEPSIQYSAAESYEQEAVSAPKEEEIEGEEPSLLPSATQASYASLALSQEEAEPSKAPVADASSKKQEASHRPELPSSPPVELSSASSSQALPESKTPSSHPSDSPSSSPEEKPKVNLNTATKEELLTLTGMSINLANKIIAQREQAGPYEKIEDLMKVLGIDQRFFDRIKDSICV